MMIKVIKVLMTIICLNVPVECVTDTAEEVDDDLDNDDNEDAVITFLQSSFWTSKEIKVILKSKYVNLLIFKNIFIIHNILSHFWLL